LLTHNGRLVDETIGSLIDDGKHALHGGLSLVEVEFR
jgi:hypothetical protein